MAHQSIFFITWPNHKIMERKFQDNFLGMSQDDLWCGGWPSSSSGTVIIIQVWTWRTAGSWHSYNHARELKFGKEAKTPIPWWSMTRWLTLSSKYLVRNLQSPPSMDMKVGRFLRHFQLYEKAEIPYTIGREVWSNLGMWRSSWVIFFGYFRLTSIYIYI